MHIELGFVFGGGADGERGMGDAGRGEKDKMIYVYFFKNWNHIYFFYIFNSTYIIFLRNIHLFYNWNPKFYASNMFESMKVCFKQIY